MYILVFKSESPTLLSTIPQKSVAERIQELGSATSSQSNGFSTKINVSLGNSSNDWEETGKFNFHLNYLSLNRLYCF